MTDAELIAVQAHQIADAIAEVKELRHRIKKAISHIICIGGPLNDNRLQYSMVQLKTFQSIMNELYD